MFEPPDFLLPVTKIPQLYTTQEDYCAVAVRFAEETDNTFNYSFGDMLQNNEIYKISVINSPPKYETGLGFYSLNAYCSFLFEENTLVGTSATNYDMLAQNPNACQLLNTNYPNFLNKINTFLTPEYKNLISTNNIFAILSEIRQVRGQGKKYRRMDIRFTDQQYCQVNNIWSHQPDGSLQFENENCLCPIFETIEEPGSNPQTPVVDEQIIAQTLGTSVTAPVTDEPNEQS